MDFLQSIDPGNTVLIVLGCVCLCGVGLVFLTGFQIVGGFLDIFTSVFGMFFEVLSGGPVAWCGCLVLAAVCIGGVGLAILIGQGLATCGTPLAINFCSLIGR